MKKAEKILGIISMITFALGIFFKYYRLPGASILVSSNAITFSLGYLVLNLINGFRDNKAAFTRGYLFLKFFALFFLMTGIIFYIQFWPGGSIMIKISSLLLLLLLIYYIVLWAKGDKPVSSWVNALILGIIGLGIFIYLASPTISKIAKDISIISIDRYVQENAGIISSNELIYNSLKTTQSIQDPELENSIDELRKQNVDIRTYIDKVTADFIRVISQDQSSTIEELGIGTDVRTLISGNMVYEYFIYAKRGEELKIEIQGHLAKTREIAGTHNLQSGMIGLGLDFEDVEDHAGDTWRWETYTFLTYNVMSAIRHLQSIKQKLLLTESTMLYGLISQVDLGNEAMLLQTMAAKETERAMQAKEDEIIKTRQKQVLQELALKQSEAELQQRNLVIVFAFIGIALVLAMFFISLSAYGRKRKANKLLSAQKVEISIQRDQIQVQRDLVSGQHTEIKDSINYAKKIQHAVLPSEKQLTELLPEHFVLFKPRDIVSGDFYWIKQIKNFTIVVAADCTGHGVPGAFMSMLGVSMLNEIVGKSRLDSAGEFLDRLRKKVKSTLNQEGKEYEQKDGMDLSMLIIDSDSGEMQFAGAFNPVYIIRKPGSGDKSLAKYATMKEGPYQLFEVKADRQPISIYQEEKDFTTKFIQLQQGDSMYMFSDGYPDQMGGPRGKKFMIKRFKHLLLDIQDEAMDKQKEKMDKTLMDWQSETQQIDDILVFGIKWN